MVASNFLGCSSNLLTISFLPDVLSAESRSVFEREKKATSDPDMRAEQIKSTKSAIKPIVNGQSMEIAKNKLDGSGSNYYLFS